MKRTVQLFLIIFSLLIIPSNVLANDINNIDISYRAHVARIGWMDPIVKLGNPIGTTGDFRQLEGIEFQTECLPIGLTLKARGYVSNRGWQDYIVNNGVIGTTDEGLALEAIELNFEPIAGFESDYDIYYRVHVTRLGWLGWTKNGKTAGTTGFALPIEAVETKVVPSGTVKLEDDTDSYIGQDQIDDLNLKFSLDTSSGKTKTSDNAITTSDNETFYGLSAKLNDPESSIAYQAHCSYIGWCGWKQDGKVSGDDNNPVEAVQFKLLGLLAEKYDIYYQVSIPYYGWLD